MIEKNIVLNKTLGTQLSIRAHTSCAELPMHNEWPLVLIFPGGGYSSCSAREGEPVADAFYAAGFQTAVLTYRTGKDRNFEGALEDVDQAYHFLWENADTFRIDSSRIGYVGFSAGGHLALSSSLLSHYHPRFCVLGYTPTSAKFAHLMGISAPNLPELVTEDTPPMFIFGTVDDEIVPAMEILRLMQCLDDNDISYEAHLYGSGRHGLSLGTSITAAEPRQINAHFSHWFSECLEWISLQCTISPKNGGRESLVTISDWWRLSEKRAAMLSVLPQLSDLAFRRYVRHLTFEELARMFPEILSSEQVIRLQKELAKD